MQNKTDWITALKTSPVAKLNEHLFESASQKKQRAPRRSTKHTDWISGQLEIWGAKNGLKIESEFRFCETRKYRFDWAIPEMKIGIEYQGGIFMKGKSGHSSATGATRDSDKSNLAQSLGWTVLTFTAMNYQHVIYELEKFNE